MIKVLLVDDSGLMRLLLQNILEDEPDISVVDTAQDGKEAHEKTLQLKPDVILLDLIMKDYDGMYAVKKIMQDIPTPIIIFSSLVNVNPDAAVEVLELGAYDFLNKPKGVFNSKVREIKAQITNKIKAAHQSNTGFLARRKNFKNNKNPHTFDTDLPYQVIVMGASTGGTNALESILLKLPENLPIPIIVIQHIPYEFGHSFARRLNELSDIPVKIARNQEVLIGNTIYILPSDCNMKLVKKEDKITFGINRMHFEAYNFPSIDSMFVSTEEVFKEKIIAVLLTGMGRDGVMGMEKIYDTGGFTIAQDEETSVIFGMPKVAIERGVIKETLALQEIPGFIVSALG